MTASGSADRRAIVGLALVALLVGAAASLLLRTRPPDNLKAPEASTSASREEQIYGDIHDAR